MIKVKQPSMALNSVDVPGAHYKMWNTWEVEKTHSADHILGWAAVVAKGAAGGYLNMLVINCHGYYGSGCGYPGGLCLPHPTGGFGLSIGTGIRRADTRLFSKLKGLVANIWITACGVARITNPGTSLDGDGNHFCSEIARYSGAYVVAGTTHQVGAMVLPFGHIDDFEGLVLRYNPAGAVDWSHDYGRSWLFDGLWNGYD